MDGCYKRIDGWVEGEIHEWISGLMAGLVDGQIMYR